MTQTLNAAYKADFDVSFSLAASQATTSYSVGSWYPQGPSGLSYTTYQVPATLQYTVVDYKIQSALTTDLGLSYIYDGNIQSSVLKANYFSSALNQPAHLSSPITINPTSTISFIAYPQEAVVTAATEVVTYSIVVSPVAQK